MTRRRSTEGAGRELARRVTRTARGWFSRSWLRRHGVEAADVGLHGLPRVRVHPGSSIRLGDGVVLTSQWRSNSLEVRGPCVLQTLAPGAVISIGAMSGLSGTTISCATSITIGSRVLLGSGVLITDSDHHLVDPGRVEDRRAAGLPSPHRADAVVVEDDVFVGARAMVLKGVRIGKGSVIGAGSVVSVDIPPGVVAAGNPCRVVRSLRGSDT